MSGSNKRILFFNTFSANELVIMIEEVNKDLRKVDKCISQDVLPISKLIHKYSSLTKEILEKYDSDQTQEMMRICAKNIEEVVTNIQVHDSISQRLAHIQLIQTGLVNELFNLKDQTLIAGSTYLPVIFEILVMNKEQLILINKDYTRAVKTIYAKLTDIEDKIKSITILYQDHLPSFSFNFKKFENLIEILIEGLVDLANEIAPYYIKSVNREEKLKKISLLFTMESERWVLNRILNGDSVEYPDAEIPDHEDSDQTELF